MTTLDHPDRVIVVIVTYNGAAWIGQCLTSIMEGRRVPSIIVVDNASTDETKQIVRHGFPQVTLIENESNLGFGQANNAGIREAMRAKADFIFLLNQDTTVNEETVVRLLDAFRRAEKRYGVICPVHLNGSGTALDFGFASYLTEHFPGRDAADLISDGDANIVEVAFVNAAAWMIRSEVFREIGGFAPLFFHYGEDRDFVSRLRFHGLKIGVVAGCTIRHHREARDMDVFSWPASKMKRYYYTGWLSRACDLSRNFPAGWFNGLRWAFSEAVAAMLKGKFLVSAAVFFALKRIIRAIPAIREHRKAVKDPIPYSFLS